MDGHLPGWVSLSSGSGFGRKSHEVATNYLGWSMNTNERCVWILVIALRQDKHTGTQKSWPSFGSGCTRLPV
jgi:hypothetical protein